MQGKIDTFERGGPDLSPGLIVGPVHNHLKIKGIYKIKVRPMDGGSQLRPLLCKGPSDAGMGREHTLLFGATEHDDRLDPPNAVERADANRTILKADPGRRGHDRI